MSRWIDADAIKNIIRSGISTDTEADQEYVCERIDEAPSIKTKQIKYFDEGESVWKVGSVIVDE